MVEIQGTGAAADAALREQVAHGFELLRQGRLADATQLSERLLAAHVGNPDALFLASEVQLAAGHAEAALALIDSAIEAAPELPTLLLKKAHILLTLRRRADARDAAAAAKAVAAGDAQTLWAIGRAYSTSDDTVSARDCYQQALDAGGNTRANPALLYDLASHQNFTGDFAGADATIETLLAAAPQSGHALYLRSTLRRQTEASNHVADLESRLQGNFPNPAGRVACLYALAKELEDLEQHDKSFAILSEAATLNRGNIRYDAAAERATIDAIGATWTAAVMQSEGPGHDEEGAIFIVGMPRTGTTLVERMLGRHDEVGSAGELMDFGRLLADAAQKSAAANPGKTPVEASLLIDFAALGRDYMASLRQAAPGRRMVVDKMPVNFMYCGLIRKALPKARIIHLARDPMDSCYAVYKTLFNQAYSFSYDLDELAAYYATYHRLMQHWNEVMPGAILNVNYEDLVANLEGEARRILPFCGLDWQPAVLSPADNELPSTTASAAQVREPVHTRSVHKWRRYEAGLAPLKARLVEAGIVAPDAV